MMVISDAWHHRALGKSAESVWTTLLAYGTMSVKGIATRTGRHANTVKRALDKLWMYGLASPVGGGRWMAEPAGMDYLQEIAAELGTQGAAKQRRISHSQERAAWASQQMFRQKKLWEHKHIGRELTSEGTCPACGIRQS